MDKDAVLKLMDRIERKWPLDPKYGQDQGWACRWSLLKMGLAAQQLAEADADRCPICGDRLTDMGNCPRD